MKTHLPPAVVVGLDCMTGLQTARILASHAVPTYGIAGSRSSAFSRTRVCRQVIAAEAGEATIDALVRLTANFETPGVLYPCTDTAVLLLSQQRNALAPYYRLALPPHEIILALMDKLKFFQYASAASLPIPRTLLLRAESDLDQVAETFRFPVVLKPPLRTDKWRMHGGAKAYKLTTPSGLKEQFHQCSEWSDVLIAQEWIEGSDSNLFSCNCYLNAESKTLVTFVAKKIRQWPVEVGISSLGEECRNDVILAETIRLFEGIGHQGLGYLEMKRDERDGLHYIVEPNVGRPTGRSAIAETGGVDLLLCQYRDLTGIDFPINLSQKYGHAKWVYLRQDLRSAWHYWKANQLTVAGWWRSLKGVRKDAVFSLRDPLPFIFDVKDALTRGMQHWFHRAPRPIPSEFRKGYSVALVGSDGCGKTTIARLLIEKLPIPTASLYMGINLASDEAILPSTRLLHSVRRRFPTGRWVTGIRAFGRFMIHSAEEWHRLLLSSRMQRKGKLVIYDRYFAFDFDEFVVRHNQRSWPDRLHSWLLRHCYPSPDLTIYLDAPPAVLLERKGEGTLEWLATRRQQFLAIARKRAACCTIDANRPLADVYEQVEKTILGFVAQETATSPSRSAAEHSLTPLTSRNK